MDDIESNGLDEFPELEQPEICASDLKKYFYMIAAVALVILATTFWYKQYYSQGVGLGPLAQRYGSGAANTPTVANAPWPADGVQPATADGGQVADWISAPAADAMTVGGRVVKGGFAEVAMALRESVVNVNVVKGTAGAARTPAPEPAPLPGDQIQFANPYSGRSVENIGSGVVVRNDGYIVTNYHVVRGGDAVFVTVFDNFGTERYRADIVKLDEALDLALLKVQPKVPMKAAVLGDSSRLRVADEVIAMGSPFGLDQTVSRGIISARREALAIEGVTHSDLLQTDAAINQGNSGGPLVNIRGEVIGINTAIYTPTGAFAGVGFAVSSNQAKRFIADEIDLRVSRVAAPGGMDRRLLPIAMPSQQAGGIGNAGPAIIAGARSPHNDGRERMDCASCHDIISQGAAPGGPFMNRAAAFQYRYAEPPSGLAMNIVNAPGIDQVPQQGSGMGAGVPAPGAQGFAVLGAGVKAIDEILAGQLNHEAGRGVFVTAVIPGSPASKAGLRPGDIVLKADGRQVRSPYQLAATVAGNTDTTRLTVLRDGQRERLEITGTALAPGGGGQPAGNVPTEFNWLGMEIENFATVTPEWAPAGTPLSGAQIAEITGGSQAALAGLRANDVILEINRQQVGTPALLDRAIRDAGETGTLLRVDRGGREFFVVVQ